MRKKTGSTSKRENFLGEWFYLSAMRSILVRRTETVVETWLCKLFFIVVHFFSLIFGWFSSHASRHGRAYAYIHSQREKEREIRVIDGFCIFFLFSIQFNTVVHQENEAQMIFCLICAFIQMNENRAVFSPFIAYPSLGFFIHRIFCLLTKTHAHAPRKNTKEKKRSVGMVTKKNG